MSALTSYSFKPVSLLCLNNRPPSPFTKQKNSKKEEKKQQKKRRKREKEDREKKKKKKKEEKQEIKGDNKPDPNSHSNSTRSSCAG